MKQKKMGLADSYFAAAIQSGVYDSLITDCKERNPICTKECSTISTPVVAEAGFTIESHAGSPFFCSGGFDFGQFGAKCPFFYVWRRFFA